MAAEVGRHVLMTADTVGGVWNHALELAAGLGQHGVRVTLATMGAPLNAAQRAQAADLPSVRLYDSPLRLEWMAEPWADVRQAGDWLLRLEEATRPDVVHLNQFCFGALPFKAPKLVVAHSCVLSWWRAVHHEAAPAAWGRYRRTVAQGLAGAALVGAPSHAMLASVRANYGWTGAGTVLPNGRSGQAYAPAARKDKLIVAAGRLWDAAKNLEALEAVAPRLPWPVKVAGSTSQPTGGVREANAVDALGELAPHELARLFARAAIYALPARYEPFGQTALEAALSGCALVLGDVDSLREVWGPAALYVPPDDHDALHAALKKLIRDDALRNRYARDALARAQRFTPERMVATYLHAYGELLQPGAGPAPPRPGSGRPSTEGACAS